MGWSEKYKKSIDCKSPKGFSQKAHCQGRKKRNETTMKLSELKEAIREISRNKFYESLNEGVSTEEKRIAMLAVRKQAKYRTVSLEQAIQDQINALLELQRDAKKGKLK